MRIFDLHCDTIDSLALAQGPSPLEFFNPRTQGDLLHNNLQLAGDRMLEAAPDGWCQAFAIWVPDDLGALGLTPRAFYERVRSYFAAQVRAHQEAFSQVRNGGQIDAALAAGKVAALLAVEGASPVEEDLAYLDRMYADGVRMVTLTWNGPNSIASGHDTTDGLTSFGRRVVRRMGDLGMVIDVSHLNDQGFSDLLGATDKPFVASHSNARSVCPHPRNLTDDQFRAIADRGGLVGINYYRAFVTDRIAPGHHPVAPRDEVTFEELAAHIDHFLDLGGQEVLALGSDFDGSTVPAWLDGAQTLPAFRKRLADRYGEALAERICYGNARAFFGRTLGA